MCECALKMPANRSFNYLYFRMRDYKHKEAYVGMFSQIGELYNVKVGTQHFISKTTLILKKIVCKNKYLEDKENIAQ